MSSSFAVYLVGFVVLIAGLGLAGHLAGMSSEWIGVGAVVLLGVGILTGVTRTQRKAPPS